MFALLSILSKLHILNKLILFKNSSEAVIWNREFGQILVATSGQCRVDHFILGYIN